jgi:hypothetical protein
MPEIGARRSRHGGRRQALPEAAAPLTWKRWMTVQDFANYFQVSTRHCRLARGVVVLEVR